MAVSSTVILFSLPPHRDLLPPLFFLLHQVDKLVLPRDEHLRIAIVIFIVPFVVNVSTPVSLSALSCCQICQSIQLIMNMHSPLPPPSPSPTLPFSHPPPPTQVVMFWIVDSILMRKKHKPTTVVHFHRNQCNNHHYDHIPSEDSDSSTSDCSVTMETRHSDSNVER